MKVKARETATFKTRQESACLETKKCEKNTILHKQFCVTGRIMHIFLEILDLD